ncbi:MAG: sortase [Thermomicrobiales bacterium]
MQFAAVAFLMIGAAAASITIWQIVESTPAEAELSGPAPVLIGDAPPPMTATPQPTPINEPATPTTPSEASPLPSPSSTPDARNLAPATMPEPTATPTGVPPEPTPSPDGAARSASRELHHESAVPVALRIPRISISAPVVPVGLNERGEMASPTGYEEIGWWQHGAAPGDFGRAVLAGHVDSPTGEAIFYRLDQLAPGDEIFVSSQDGDGRELRFVVSGAALYHIDHAPVDHIFGPSTDRELILITCGGTFDHDNGFYLYRRVVFAKLAD